MLQYMLFELSRKIPAEVREILRNLMRKIPLGRKLLNVYFSNKYTAELSFQRQWAREFSLNKEKVLEYWRKYRYLDKIVKICGIDEKKKILDVGCGISTVLHFIKGQKYGIDPLADEYKKLYSYPEDIKILKGFGEKIPFQDEYFDIVFCSNALDHMENPRKVVEEIHRVLKKSGYFILTIEIFSEDNIKKRDPAHPFSFTKKAVKDLVKDKFEIIFQKESPWIGLKNYVEGLKNYHNKELILIMRKI